MKRRIGCCVAAAALASATGFAAEDDWVPADVGHPVFASPHANPIAVNGNYVYVANTPADTVDVIDRRPRRVVARINVGIDPVSIAVRPDGREVWVANHVSTSPPASPSPATRRRTWPSPTAIASPWWTWRNAA